MFKVLFESTKGGTLFFEFTNMETRLRLVKSNPILCNISFYDGINNEVV